jgi:C1A family cysteine protease
MCTQRTVFTALVVTALLCGVVSLPADEVVPETYAFSTSLVADAPPTLNVTTTPDITQAEAEQTPPPSPVEAADDAAAVIQAKQELPSRVRVVEAADDGAAVIQAKQELPSRVRVFLKQAHNQMRRACGKDHTSMREVHVAGWSKQVVGDGEEFTIKYNPVFKLTSSEQPRQFQITLQKIFDATKITERVGTPKTTADKFHILAMSPEVCDMKSIFTTQKSEDKLDLPTQEMLLTQQQFTGHIDPPESEITYDTTLLSEQQKASIPDSINWADKLKGARVATAYNQGTCGSCYAWAATTAYGYRLAKESNMRYNVWPSPQSAMSCSNGCDGGSAFGVYNAMETRGGMPPWWCNKYNFQAPSTTQCQASCGSSHRYSIVPGSTKQIKAKSAGGIAQAEQKIMHEIATNGPAYGSLHASDGLMKHKGWGITSASDSVGAKATHAVTVVGFGIDNGHKYWIIQNSWGSNWGEEGFGRITRGNDALGIESGGITFTTPKVPTHCASAPICKNGASYNKQCHCHCLSGWSGTTCNTCDRDCSTGNLAGKSKIVNGKCQCACKKGYYSLGKTECGTKITLGGSTKKNYTPPGNFVSITLENPDNAVREGDFYVAVPAREPGRGYCMVT